MKKRDYIGLGLFAILIYLAWDARKRITELESTQRVTVNYVNALN